MLLDLLQKKSKFEDIYSEISKNGQIVHGLTNSAKSLMLSTLLGRATRAMIFLVSSHQEAQLYAREIKNLCPDRPVYNFQAQEVSPYEQINSDIDVLSVQYEIFNTWMTNKPSLTVMPVKALSQLYIEKDLLKNNQVVINKNLKIEPQTLSEQLVKLGYSQVSSVELKGQFSRRGDILDVYPINGRPIRLEFFGDDIESIRLFDTSTQRSSQDTDSLVIYPRFSVIRDGGDDLHDRVVSTITDQNLNDLLEMLDLNSELYPEGIEYYRELLAQGASTLFDYMPTNSHLIYDEWHDLSTELNKWIEKLETSYAEKQEQGKVISLKQSLHLDYDDIVSKLGEFPTKLYLQVMNESFAEADLTYDCLLYTSDAADE